jgi:hypothetical protein
LNPTHIFSQDLFVLPQLFVHSFFPTPLRSKQLQLNANFFLPSPFNPTHIFSQDLFFLTQFFVHTIFSPHHSDPIYSNSMQISFYLLQFNLLHCLLARLSSLLQFNPIHSYQKLMCPKQKHTSKLILAYFNFIEECFHI